jgi:hypothetical protein
MWQYFLNTQADAQRAINDRPYNHKLKLFAHPRQK